MTKYSAGREDLPVPGFEEQDERHCAGGGTHGSGGGVWCAGDAAELSWGETMEITEVIANNNAPESPGANFTFN
ncbi:MAG: hypothetical protein LBB61_01855 [Treponema sp.]|nr:hypothetical protein [Treponema sp.]